MIPLISLGNPFEARPGMAQNLVAAGQYINRLYPSFNPFANLESFNAFARLVEEDVSIMWHDQGIDPEMLMEAIGWLQNDPNYLMKFLADPNAAGNNNLVRTPDSDVYVDPSDENKYTSDPQPERKVDGSQNKNGNAEPPRNSGLIWLTLGIAGLFMLWPKKKKGLSGIEPENRPEPIPVPAILNGTSKKSRKTLKIKI